MPVVRNFRRNDIVKLTKGWQSSFMDFCLIVCCWRGIANGRGTNLRDFTVWVSTESNKNCINVPFQWNGGRSWALCYKKKGLSAVTCRKRSDIPTTLFEVGWPNLVFPCFTVLFLIQSEFWVVGKTTKKLSFIFEKMRVISRSMVFFSSAMGS